MISEPELVGGGGFERPEVLTEAPPSRPPRARRPWLWALGGAVAASAVWGGGLYAYERAKPTGPDLGGYKEVDDLCGKAGLEALAGVLGKRSEEGAGPLVDDPTLHRRSCMLTFGSPETGYSGNIVYTLHKATDPGPEFGAWGKYYELATPIDGVGEKALFDDRGGEGGELRVLDGQVEIELSVSRQYVTDENGELVQETEPVDLSGIEVPMTQDLLALMAELRK
ncbi:hypothetical protein GCM10010497_04870 [Streptomyces cinereoruber]|uniref:DUF3515 domain-containing protein n=1 Tax=Streptomyces cinereoruber TaxID=67260 RepID=A0AAV4KAT5_9ACTN|nr:MULTISPECIES: hypothetical protein [Streptomyces]AVH95701.1 hypothetical protein C5L38_11995 [Streptomyces sp. WAC00288]KYG54375.1 hypothetical protein AWI43_07820 [Streptomyces sp. WAC04657]MBB4157322.1 hypothetical protein [Streptomyces cinereoruber]MBY8814864.1 hypothetical protein [Streptomyces cinereoruber]NIH59580.1 hypothetical protein [Streptomyces cinereoruber]